MKRKTNKSNNNILFIAIGIIFAIGFKIKYDEKKERELNPSDEHFVVEENKPNYIIDNYTEELYPDDFIQITNQEYKDYKNIFHNKITPLNYMYRSTDDVDKKNIYTNQYVFKKFMNVNGIGSGEIPKLYALEEHEQDNYSYLPSENLLTYDEEL